MAIYDVILNIKRGSPKGTYSQVFQVEAKTKAEALKKMKLQASKDGVVVSHYKKPEVKKSPVPAVDSTGDGKGKEDANLPDDDTGLDSQIANINAMIDNLKRGERLRLPYISDEVYFGTNGIGSTAMREAHKSMAHFRAYMDDDKVVTPQLQVIYDFGSGTHCAVLEPEHFEERYAQMPEKMIKRGKDYTEFKEANKDKTILSFDAYNHILNIKKAVKKSVKMNKFTSYGVSEVAYFYKDMSGMILKAKVDHDFESDLGVDLKTTKDAQPEKAMKTAKYDYSVQCALYRLVTGLPEFLFLMVEKVPPYAKSMVKNNIDVRNRADKRLRNVINQLIDATKADKWPAYDEDTIYESELTSWEMGEDHNE